MYKRSLTDRKPGLSIRKTRSGQIKTRGVAGRASPKLVKRRNRPLRQLCVTYHVVTEEPSFHEA